MTLLTKKGSLTTLGLCMTFATVGCTGGSGSKSSLDPRFQTSDTVQFVQDGVSGLSDVSAQASGLSISIALAINAPSPTLTGGTQLYASDLRVAGNRVMTAYNVPGNVQKDGLIISTSPLWRYLC